MTTSPKPVRAQGRRHRARRGSSSRRAWTEAEHIVVLDRYRRQRDDLGRGSQPVSELSKLLGRTKNAVLSEINAFRKLDRDEGAAKWRGVNEEHRRLWGLSQSPVEFETLMRGLRDLHHGLAEEDEALYPEGTIAYRLHRLAERSGEVVQQKKAAAKRMGSLRCEVCGFDFGKTYGPIADGYIECHHVTPLAGSRGLRQTRLRDLALVCANCHRVLHRGERVLTPSELRERLRRRSAQADRAR
jgi:predicted HNH restriction endonuclease